MLNIISAPVDIDKNAESHTKKIVKHLKSVNKEYAVYFSQTLESFKATVTELTSMNETDFVLVGGDVALHCFLNACKDVGKIRLGIVPTSAQDDFATYLNLSTNPVEAIKEILMEEIQPIDYLIANDQIVINNILLGASVEIASATGNAGTITEKINEWRLAPLFEGVQVQLDFKSGKPKKENIFELSVANGGLSKGKRVSPLANVKDGLFNLNYVSGLEEKERRKYVGEFNAGNQTYDEKTKQFWLSGLKITGEETPLKLMLDGQIETMDSVNIMLVEQGLKLFRITK